MDKIVDLYVRLIRKGEWTIDQVPMKWRDAVNAILFEDAVRSWKA